MTAKRRFALTDEITRILASRRELLAKAHPDRQIKQIDFNRDGDELTLFIYGVIGEDFWGDGIAALDVAKLLADHSGAERIVARVNSPGGDVFDGVAIYNALATHNAEVTIQVDGLAASAASVIAMAGDTIEMLTGSQMMIHRAWTYALGNAEELSEVANVLETIDEEAASLYAARSGRSAAEMLDLMSAETWLTPTQAQQRGLADVVSTTAPESSQAFDRSQFNDLRIAAFVPNLGDHTMPKTETEKPADVVQADEPAIAVADADDEDTVEEPTNELTEVATFDQLRQIGGTDATWICGQLEAGATLREAQDAWVARLANRLTEKDQQLAEANQRIAALESAEASAVSGNADNDGRQKSGRLVDKIRMPSAPSAN